MKKSWGNVVKEFFSFKMIVTFLMGISSGLPLLLVGSTLQAWMTNENVDLALIGIFALVKTPYSFKFLWAPLMDRYIPPFLGRRRGWMLITQVGLMLSIAALSFSRPAEAPHLVALIAVLIAFLSASQDIVIDAYRRELLTPEELGLGSSLAVNGYRIGLLVSGAFALYMADRVPWNVVYLLMALSMLIGIGTTLFAPNPDGQIAPPRTLKEAVIQPFIEFFKRAGALEILAFILLYKVGDAIASNMTTPFILSVGFTKTDIATIAKTMGLAATIAGGLLGGVLLLRISLYKALWMFGILQAISTLSFSYLASVGLNHNVLAFTIAFENFTSGMGTAAFTAFMASLTNKRFTATQYALLSSFMAVPRDVIAAGAGFAAKTMGWTDFFIVCTLIAIPGLVLLLFRFKAWQRPPD